MSSSSAADMILLISKQYTIYGYLIIAILGTIGNICNVAIFTCSKSLRQNQSVFYLIAASIVDCFLLLVVLPFHITEIAFDINLTEISVYWCKFRPMLTDTLELLSLSSICFAAIDQYLSTNYRAWLRQLSTLKLAHYLVYSSIFFWIIYDSILLIFYDLYPGIGCIIKNAKFARFYSYFHLIVLNSVLPILITSLFSLAAYTNVRHIVQLRVQLNRRQRDKQLTAIVLAKVAFLVVTIFPSAVFRIYILNRSVTTNDYVRLAVDQLVSSIAYSLFYFNSAVCNIFIFFNLLFYSDYSRARFIFS